MKENAVPVARAIALAVLAEVSLLAILAVLPPASAIAFQGPDLHAVLTAASSEGRVAYTLSLTNQGGLPAVDVRMAAPLPAGLTLENTGASEWSATLPDLAAQGDLQVGFVALVDDSVPAGTVKVIILTATYRAPGGSQDYVATAQAQVSVLPRGAVTPFVLVIAAAAALALALSYAWKSRLETVRIDQLFLINDSGMLIRHYTNGSGLQRDSDILGGMLIVLQEFVRDSVSEPRDSLEEVRFGDRRVLMARGRHAVIAALVRGKRLNGLPARLQRAVAQFEEVHGEALADWNGDIANLDAANQVFRDLLVPRYTAHGPA
jgi:uncharacterized repeat protein (TIGR01451 family)